MAGLPQCAGVPITNTFEEIDRCIEMGFVGIMINPDPYEGSGTHAPGLGDEYWYPLYEEAQRLGVGLIVHPSISRDPRLDRVPASYQYNNVAEEALAVSMRLAQQLAQPFFAVVRHQSLDGSGGWFLPSSRSRSLPRQRAIRLAIVPCGISSSDEIVL